MLKDKKIVLGVTGSIAAYKACLLIRGLTRRGAQVQTVITPAGKEFITPLTLSTLTGRPVISEFFDRRDGSWNSHVDIGRWADAMLIAPCTASTIGKMARGIADNMLVTTYMAMRAPVFVAPAMDVDMYSHPAMKRNLSLLRSFGNHIIEPGTGALASGLEGKGRMEEPETIISILDKFFDEQDDMRRAYADERPHTLAGKTILVTAGPTYEKIDPVRFIGNYSSGKMGFALAKECARRGAQVTLICGPVSLAIDDPSVRRIDVEDCDQMYAAAMEAFPQCDAAVLCAAVCDFRPDNVAEAKIKREGGGLTLRLRPTHDIAAALGAIKRPDQRLVGFALETDHEESNATSKLVHKHLDFIVLNSLRNSGTCFRSDENMIEIISAAGRKKYPQKSKAMVAADIIDELEHII